MASLIELKQEKTLLLGKAQNLIATAETFNRDFTSGETAEFETLKAGVDTLNAKIASVEKGETLRAQLRNDGPGFMLGGRGAEPARGVAALTKQTLSADYVNAFGEYLQSNGQKTSAALYEGANTSGGFTIPTQTLGVISPLAPPEVGVRSIATVIPTVADLKIPIQTALSTASFKAESGATANLFQETEPSGDSVTLGAFMLGSYVKISFELAADVTYFQNFVTSDLLQAQTTLEEQWFVHGSGVNQGQGLLGNVGAGITATADPATVVSIDSTFDVVGSLNAKYLPNAKWLMSRQTAVLIRKAQQRSNLFEGVFVREGGKDFLHGFEVCYSSAMPLAAKGTTPALFGDFGTAFVIGDRGGSGMTLKILDQPFATAGQIATLCYRRVDSRVRRAEAVQSLNISNA